MEELDAESAISAGGWDSRYAVTLAVATRGDIAAALIDTNGDGADLDLDEYQRGADGHWQESVSGSVDERGAHWSSRIASTWGQADPGARVEIEYLGHSHSVVASRSGWWHTSRGAALRRPYELSRWGDGGLVSVSGP